jgi:hypothetical protein
VPEPQPISRGNRFHGSPVRRTNKMPVSTARSGWGFRPAYCRCRSGRFGSNGSMRSQSASSIENVAIWPASDTVARPYRSGGPSTSSNFATHS